ncbi:MAG TPA: phosphatase PAP2 family protein [Xanthobacteraceae bacterium]
MSVAGELKPQAEKPALPFWRRFLANGFRWHAMLSRPRRLTVRPAWRAPARLALIGLLAALAVAATMVFVDAPAIVAVGRLPSWVVELFNTLTDFGTSDWFLVPIGVVLLTITALASPAAAHLSRLVLTAFAVRLGFVFVAIALPGLFTTVIKRLIGRARPFIGGDADPFRYAPLVWRSDYASLPSGHATNVFAALVAIGLVVPRLRAPLLIYALIIAASRVIVLAHHPSDVIAGAVVGVVGALLVRDWSAARRLGFTIDAQGNVRALPGPSLRRLKAVAREFLAA